MLSSCSVKAVLLQLQFWWIIVKTKNFNVVFPGSISFLKSSVLNKYMLNEKHSTRPYIYLNRLEFGSFSKFELFTKVVNLLYYLDVLYCSYVQKDYCSAIMFKRNTVLQLCSKGLLYCGYVLKDYCTAVMFKRNTVLQLCSKGIVNFILFM